MAKLDRADRHGASLSQELAATRELIRQASKLLADPAPDTFLGRKTQEPFAAEKKPRLTCEIVRSRR
jgi:hypothetical protein